MCSRKRASRSSHLAKEYHVFADAIVFDLPERLCQDRNALRPDRQFGPHVVRNQSQQLRRSLRGLEREGIRHVFKLSSPEEVDSVTIERQPLWNNRKSEHGPFDIVGDVHGCFDELIDLLAQLGYTVDQQDGQYTVTSPQVASSSSWETSLIAGPAQRRFFASSLDLVQIGHRLSVFPATTILSS